MPVSWSGKPDDKIMTRSMLGVMTIGMAFGAIHFIAWNSEFPSDIEHFLWRISSVAITTAPLILVILSVITERGWGAHRMGWVIMVSIHGSNYLSSAY